MAHRFARLWLVLMAFVLIPGALHAACGGSDLMPGLAADNPVGHQEIFARAAQAPNASGKFWRIEKPGIAPSHLFGTFHDTEAHQLIGAEIWDRLAASDSAWFELSLAEEARMQADIAARPLEIVFDMSQPPLSERLSQDQRDLIAQALESRGIPFQAAEQMRSWMLVALLGFPACEIRALQAGEQSLDQRLAQFAVDRGIVEAGLETYEQSLAGIEDMSDRDLLDMLADYGRNLGGEEDQRRTRLGLYQSGEIMAIAEFGIWQAEQQGFDRAREMTDRFFESALTKRNIAWLDRLIPALEGGNAFVAVGALHLPGESGLVRLLRDQGWTVTRLDG